MSIGDELHAAAIRSALDALNDAIAAAYIAGLAVGVSVQDFQYATRFDSLPVITVHVHRPV